MDAIEYLENEHQTLLQLFHDVDQAEEYDEKLRRFDILRSELGSHTMLEENHFFPALNDFEDLQDSVEDCFDDLQEMRDLLTEISEADEEEEFEGLFSELSDVYESHFRVEEEELFPRARATLPASVLDSLYRVMIDEKRKATAA